MWRPLRDELDLREGPRRRSGEPTWTLHDPARNQYFELDWLSFEVLAHWALGSPAAIVAAIRAETTLRPTVSDVATVRRFLDDHQLLQPAAIEAATVFARRLRERRASLWKTLLHHYLFFRIPLFSPDRLLTALMPHVGWLLTRRFLHITALAGLGGLALIYRDWDVFHATLLDTLTWEGAVLYALTLVFVKTLHEFGHGLTAKHFGCRVPAMGVAFLVLWPMPYTDTNDAWKLASRRARLAIGLAGVTTELVVAVWSTLAWSFLPDGPLRGAAFLLATTTWISTLVVNCSPFMRFDGYFVLADFFNVPNLHARAFALGRWQLREWLFDLRLPPPEPTTPALRRGLITFAYATWIYRLVVFLGIAFLVYAFFIKLVGIVLFLVEIAWFVIMPLVSEFKAWRALAPRIRARSRRWFPIGFLCALVALVFVPLPGRLAVSGLLTPGEEYPVHARDGMRLEALYVADGQRVEAGAPLFRFSTEQLDQRLSAARSRVQRQEAEVAVSAFAAEQRGRLPVKEQELQTAAAARRGVEAERRDYELRAPAGGRIRLHDPDLRPGQWLARREPVAILVADRTWRVESFVDEDRLHRIAVGQTARFYPDTASGATLALKVASIDVDAQHVLESPLLAAVNGGSVAAREVNGRLVPEKAVYRVLLDVQHAEPTLSGQAWRGTVVIHAARESPIARFGRALMQVVWREAGF